MNHNKSIFLTACESSYSLDLSLYILYIYTIQITPIIGRWYVSQLHLIGQEGSLNAMTQWHTFSNCKQLMLSRTDCKWLNSDRTELYHSLWFADSTGMDWCIWISESSAAISIIIKKTSLCSFDFLSWTFDWTIYHLETKMENSAQVQFMVALVQLILVM